MTSSRRSACNWAGWIGAVVLVIGAGLGIKYAYDQRWFELPPAGSRLALMSLGGFALIGAGEWVFRRDQRRRRRRTVRRGRRDALPRRLRGTRVPTSSTSRRRRSS